MRDMIRTMTQKKFGKDGYTRSTLADIAREMEKPRMTESVRNAPVVAPAPEVQGTNRISRKVMHVPQMLEKEPAHSVAVGNSDCGGDASSTAPCESANRAGNHGHIL